MDPALDGYISLEEEATISPPQCVDSPNVTEPWQAKPAADESAPPEADTAEIVEAGVPEEPCFYGHGPTWDNRHWRGWKPRNTPRMPPKRRSTGDTQQLPPPSITSQVTCQLQEPLRELGHEEFCQKMNDMLLPCDDAERGTFDQQDVFILGDPAACFDRSSGHCYDRKFSNPHAGFPEWKKIFAYILRDCGYLVDYDTIYVLVDTRNNFFPLAPKFLRQILIGGIIPWVTKIFNKVHNSPSLRNQIFEKSVLILKSPS